MPRKSYSKRTLVILVILLIGSVWAMWKLKNYSQTSEQEIRVDLSLVKEVEQWVKVTPSPSFLYSYAIMEEGVIQHLDRTYTYDVIPRELKGGYLFQGIHRPQAGTQLEIELLRPTTIYFFFHATTDGGYSQIFEELETWQRLPNAPQYDIHNGDHGLDMTLYKLEGTPGIHTIPATTEDRACFSIVFKAK
ncbi:MAG: hypothetical protein AAFP76_09540 [Bacteroidota bacterium]